MCLLCGCDYEQQNRDGTCVLSKCECVPPACVSLHLFAVFLISVSQHGRFVSLIVSVSVLLNRAAADPPRPELQRVCERLSLRSARPPVGCLVIKAQLGVL